MQSIKHIRNSKYTTDSQKESAIPTTEEYTQLQNIKLLILGITAIIIVITTYLCQQSTMQLAFLNEAYNTLKLK